MTPSEEFKSALLGEAAKIGELLAFVEKYKDHIDKASSPSVGSNRLQIYLHKMQDPKAFCRAVGGQWSKVHSASTSNFDYKGVSPDGFEIHIFDAEKPEIPTRLEL